MLEKGMATDSSILAWRIPWTEDPGGLQAMGLHMTEAIEHSRTHLSYAYEIFIDKKIAMHIKFKIDYNKIHIIKKLS